MPYGAELFLSIFIVILILIKSLYYMMDNYKITPHQYFFPEYYKVKFIESSPNLTLISSEKIIILVAAYNSDIDLLIKRILYLSEGFADFKVFIYGLDSTSYSTLADLKIYSNHYPKNIFLIPPVKLLNLNRIERITKIRNILLNHIKKLNISPNYKILVYDSDHIGPMSKNGLIDAILRLNQKPEIYAICASGTVPILPGLLFLYDSFAYINKNYKHKFKLKLHCLLKEYNLIVSGFSGAVLYRYSDLINFEYEYVPNTCEHVVLHKALKLKFQFKYNKECFMEMSKKFQIYVGLQPSIL
jgi:hypothetical protein